MNALQRLFLLPPRQLVGMAIALAAVIALISGAFLWSQAPDYRVLLSGLEDKDGGAVVQALSAMNVPYRFTDGGTAIMVPSELVYDTRLKLASQGLPKRSTGGFDLLENQKFGTTQFQEQVNYQRGLEGELARSIQSIASVQVARVHLALPKASVFLREQQKPSASVLVTLYSGKSLDRTQIAGIVHLISSSVPELTADNVSIIDQNGNLLTHGAEANTGLDPGKLAYVSDVERGYNQRILSIVAPIVGAENVRAQVAADLDFSQIEQTSESYKPNGNPGDAAVRSQQSSETQSDNSGAGASGVPGAQSNLGQPANGQAAATPTTATSTQKSSTVNYEVDKNVQLKRLPVGSIKRLSAAIVINYHKVTDKDGSEKSLPLDAKQLEQINALVKEAIGFDTARGDSLNIVNTAFNQPAAGEAGTELPVWKDPANVALGKSIAKDVLLGMLVLYLVFGVLRPNLKRLTGSVESEQVVTAEALALEEAGAVADGSAPALPSASKLQIAQKLARDDPRVAASVLKSWVANHE